MINTSPKQIAGRVFNEDFDNINVIEFNYDTVDIVYTELTDEYTYKLSGVTVQTTTFTYQSSLKSDLIKVEKIKT